MERQEVESSCVAEVGYDIETLKLEVRFTSGSVYQYSNVTPEEHREVVSAASVGKAFWDIIRRREDVHPFVRVS